MTAADIKLWFAALDGAEIVGGCENCDAYQTTSIDADGILHLTVHHDDWCPSYRRMQRKRGLLR